MSFRVRGSYFESCNCEAICPCRMVDGVKGGRSTYGVCYGALSWLIDEGSVGEVDVSGLAVALVMRYDDDEPGSPWTLALHVDERGSQEQQNALADVFLGRLSGPHVDTLPWIRKARHLIDVRPSAVELMPEGDGYVFGSATWSGCGRPAASRIKTPSRASSPATSASAPSCTRTSSSATTGLSRGSSPGTAPSPRTSSTPRSAAVAAGTLAS